MERGEAIYNIYIAVGAPKAKKFQNRSKKSVFLKKKYMFLVRGEAIYSCRRAADDTFFAPQAKKIQNRSKNRVLKSTCFWRAAKLCIAVGAPQAKIFQNRSKKSGFLKKKFTIFQKSAYS